MTAPADAGPDRWGGVGGAALPPRLKDIAELVAEALE